jgi:hypothetical protein
LYAIVGWSQTNVLTIPDVSIPSGGTISLPIQFDNATDIIAVEFDLTVADGITLDYNAATLTDRVSDHVLTVRPIEINKYKFMLYSPTNTPIVGRTGLLGSIPLTISSSIGDGNGLPMTLSSVVATGNDGTNLITGYSSGKVVISKSPDFEVSNVTASPTSISPGDTMNVNWTVTNIGDLPTTGGWSEQIFLETTNGTSKLLTTVYYDNVLNPSGVVSRNANIVLPDIIGIDGDSYIKVKLVSNSTSGEPSWLTANNTAVTNGTINVKQQLNISPGITSIEEKANSAVRLYLTRSGNTDNDETFVISSTADSRMSVPASIIITKGQSGAYIVIPFTANGKLDNNSIINISISGSGYDDVNAEINIEDDTNPALSINCEVDEMTEGDNLKLIIEAQRAPIEDLTIKLACDITGRFNIPSIIIPAGQTSVEATIEAIDDDTPDILQIATFTASASGYIPTTYTVDLIDNDMPTMELYISPVAVSESAGPLAITAKLRRTSNIDKNVTIKFSDDSDGSIYYSKQTVEMAAGVAEVNVKLGPINNALVDGERTYNISAAIWIPTCGCSASTGNAGGIVTVPFTIYDDDGPTLSMTSSTTTVKEGGEFKVTVTRNTDVTEPLTVNISSDHDSSLEYSNSVTIPAESASATFTVKSVEKDINGDSFTATMTCDSEGYAKGNIWFIVTDQTLPDGQISSLTLSNDHVDAGATVDVKATITNTGLFELPELTKVGFYASYSSTALATAYLQESLPIGKSVVVSKTITMPNAIGTYEVYAIVNDGQSAKELDYTNNTSSSVSVRTVSPFAVSLTTDKKVYTQGESVIISGKIDGNISNKQPLDIYLMHGYRQVISVTTNEQGVFSTTWTPVIKQCGHFAIGACYPGENSTNELASIDIYGIVIDTPSNGIQSTVNEEYTGTLTISNPGILPISNVKCNVDNTLESCEIYLENNGEIGTISANESIPVKFVIKGLSPTSGSYYEKIHFSVTSNETVDASGQIKYYCWPQNGKIISNISTINCTVTKGTYRDIPVVISNIGKGETGDISLSINSSWIKNITPIRMKSLQHGDSATVVLRINPDNMQLNVLQNAIVGINCENGDGTQINISMEYVSDEYGHFKLDVCDEYTYNTAEAPHLAGAAVNITHPVDNIVVATGVTNADGLFEVDLPEGYYGLSITADNHTSYSNNVLINPGKDNLKKVDLSYTGGIKIAYTVQPIEGGIEDSYEIITTVTYETNVPMPIVVLDGPSSIDALSMQPGESTILNYVATNKGLITAMDFQIELPEANDDFSLTPLYDTTTRDIPANTSETYPILFTRNPNYNSNNNTAPRKTIASDLNYNFSTCITSLHYKYSSICGTDLRDNRGALMLSLKACAYSSLSKSAMDVLANVISWSNSGVGVGSGSGSGDFVGGGQNIVNIGSNSGTYVGIDPDKTICNPDFAEAVNDGVNEALGAGLGPIASAVNSGVDLASELAVDGRPSSDTLSGLAASAVTPFMSEGAQMACDAAQKVHDAYSYLSKNQKQSDDNIGSEKQAHKVESSTKQSTLPDWLTCLTPVVEALQKQLDALIVIQDEVFGNHSWIDHYDESILLFITELSKLAPNEISMDRLNFYKPEYINKDMLDSFVTRYYNTINGDTTSINIPNYANIINSSNIIQQIEAYAKENGYDSMEEMYRTKVSEYLSKYDEESSSVCSSISLQFSQQLVMTREAFRGTLTVYNGHDSEPMQDMILTLTVTDEDGVNVTEHEMTIDTESTSNFDTTSDTGWNLAAKETGTATILYIPTKYAAPDEPKDYNFGGSLTYTNPYNGLRVTEMFSPVTLTVNPSPNLELTYFMQRDVLGDDPLTEAVESSQDAEFSLLIDNQGYGDATNVRMVTEQPKVIDNEKGLLIDITLESAQLNGANKTFALGQSVTTDFGTISAKSTAYAQWWFKSSLLGHFSSYDVTATHLSSYDNPELSLLNGITIHELIRSIDVVNGSDVLKGFMTNDIVDSDNTPDMLYFSNGETAPVKSASSATITKTSDMNYTLIVSPSANGWNYGSIPDPTYGLTKIRTIVRQSDGQEISLRNIWQTDRTLRDGKDPLYENRIHFVDNFSGISAETYTLTFEPMPILRLEVVSIEEVPAEGTIAQSPIEKVSVMFNKPINPDTFDSDDITLTVQGIRQDSNLIAISTEDNKSFTLDLTELNKTTGNGYYVLTVQTSGINDVEGFNGSVGKSVDWTLYMGGSLTINTSVSPQNAGEISGTFSPEYGKPYTIEAKPNDGYTFSHWNIDGDIYYDEAKYSSFAYKNINATAYFIAKMYPVAVNADVVGGSINGDMTGIYNYGESLSFEAVASDAYLFTGWIVNGADAGSDTILNIVVNEDTTVSATFKRVIFEQCLTLKQGWNWISTYLEDGIDMTTFANIISDYIWQDSLDDDVEALNIIYPYTTYKVKALYAESKTFKSKLFDISNNPIVLSVGWNWIPYPNDITLPLSETIRNATTGDIIVAQNGFAEYLGSGWIGTLSVLNPGAGYLYKSASAKTLDYNFDNTTSIIVDPIDDKVDIYAYPNTMNITAKLYQGNIDKSDNRYKIYAMCGNECRGISHFIDDRYYITVYGNDGEQISFVVENGATSDNVMPSQILVFNSDALGAYNNPYMIQVDETTEALSMISNRGHSMRIYTLSGILISENATIETIKKLIPGYYIIDGKKYLIK